MFSCEFCEISKNTFSYRTPPVPASGGPIMHTRWYTKKIKYDDTQEYCSITQYDSVKAKSKT